MILLISNSYTDDPHNDTYTRPLILNQLIELSKFVVALVVDA